MNDAKGERLLAFVLLGLWVAFILAPDTVLLDQKRAWGFAWAGLAGLWLAWRIATGKAITVPTKKFRWALGLLFLAYALAWLQSPYRQTGFFRMEVLGLGIFGALLAVSLPTTYQKLWPWVGLATSLLVSFYAIAQRLGWEPVQAYAILGSSARSVGSFGNAGYLAAFICFSWPFILLLRPWPRALALIPLILALALTQSRAGFIAFVAQGLVLGYQAWSAGLRPGWKNLGLAFFSGLIFMVSGFQWNRPTLRIQLWAESLHLSLQRPWLGWGPGTFSLAMQDHQSAAFEKLLGAGQFAEHPHNLGLSLLHEAGLVGLVVGLVLVIVCKPWPWMKLHRNAAQRAVALGLLGLLVENLFDKNFDSAGLSLCFFFGLGYLDRSPDSVPSVRLTRGTAAILMALALLCFRQAILPVWAYKAAVSNPSPAEESQVPANELLTLQEAVKANPHAAHAWDVLGDALAQRKDFSAAAQAYLAAYDLKAAAGRAQNLGNCYIMLNQAAEAVRCFRQAVALAPGSSDAHFGLGYAYFLQKHLKEAVAELDQALALDPQNFGAAKLKEQILR